MAEGTGATAPDGLRLTDVGNAQRFVDLAAGEVRYVHRWGRWIVFDRRGYWSVDIGDALVTEKAKGVARCLMSMVPKLEDPERGQVFAAARRAESAGVVIERRTQDSEAPNSYRMDIRGSGPLIPSENIERIFEEYTSYGGSQDRSGGGLGLAICRMIVNAHNGRVWAENTELGPRFSFVLPVRSQECEEPDTAQSQTVYSEL